MTSFGYYLKSLKKPYLVLAFVFDNTLNPPRIGQVVEIEGIKGYVDSYDIVGQG